MYIRLPLLLLILSVLASSARAQELSSSESETELRISTDMLDAVVRKKGYVTGVAAGTLLDKKTGSRDPGYGLDIVDWIMEPGSDEAHRDKLPDHMVYRFGNSYHGQGAKRSLEGPQICTQAKALSPFAIKGESFIAVKQQYAYPLAAPGYKHGSTWSQIMVFPKGKRYFVSTDRIDAVNASDAMFLRIDMPGHVKHKAGSSFSEIYLSYPTYGFDKDGNPIEGTRREPGVIAAKEFNEDFAPDAKFNYRRDAFDKPPKRFIRAIHLRDPVTGKEGPWLAGFTLDPSVVYEAWCHQRGYICMIEEFGGRPIKPGESFSAAFIVGYFDSIEEMHKVYDAHAGHDGLVADAKGWKLTNSRK
ncbi:MAG: hypothetical protein WD768_12350 [Phycisphaeraceae bacterium]